MRLLAILWFGCASLSAQERVVVFVAASLGPVLEELAPACQKATGSLLVVSPGASGALARQIVAGAPADLIFLADPVWMDQLAGQGLIDMGSRVDVLGNRLAIIAPSTATFSVDVTGPGLPQAFSGRLAVGDPASVPVGTYAQEAGLALEWWPALRERLAPASDARAVVRYVASGEAGAGIVYASDTFRVPGIAVVGLLPETSHRPIRYPLARAQQAGPGAQAVLSFLAGPVAAPVYRQHGFLVVAP